MRWLISIFLAACLFVGIALLLGYILHSGKEESTALANQIALDNQRNSAPKAIQEKELEKSEQPELRLIAAPVTDAEDKVLNVNDVLTIQLTNTTCEQDNQCSFVHVPRQYGCALPINQQGLALIADYAYESPPDERCNQIRYLAQCINQRCSKVIP